jgi:rhodanese-related sulfurtransferase
MPLLRFPLSFARSFSSMGEGDVSRVELAALIDQEEDFVLVDVRDPSELAFGVIPTAVNIPSKHTTPPRMQEFARYELTRPRPAYSVSELPASLAMDEAKFKVCTHIDTGLLVAHTGNITVRKSMASRNQKLMTRLSSTVKWAFGNDGFLPSFLSFF